MASKIWKVRVLNQKDIWGGFEVIVSYTTGSEKQFYCHSLITDVPQTVVNFVMNEKVIQHDDPQAGMSTFEVAV